MIMTRFSQPIIGEEITVKCQDCYDAFIGTVTPNGSGVDKNHFSMTSELPDYYKFPIRVIKLDNVESLVYDKDIEPEKEEEIVFKTYEVIGSKGDIYTVKQEGDVFICNCPGWHWRGTCKHTKALQDE